MDWIEMKYVILQITRNVDSRVSTEAMEVLHRSNVILSWEVLPVTAALCESVTEHCGSRIHRGPEKHTSNGLVCTITPATTAVHWTEPM